MLPHSAEARWLLITLFLPALVALCKLAWDEMGATEKYGAILTTLGAISNWLVISANDMRMPVLGLTPYETIRLRINNGLWQGIYSANLSWLADRFVLANALVCSVGDVFMAVGLTVYFVGLTVTMYGSRYYAYRWISTKVSKVCGCFTA